MNHEHTIDFHGAKVNLSDEHRRAREQMGKKTTDLGALLSAVIHIYVNIDSEEWAQMYVFLIKEIEHRINLVERINLGLFPKGS